MSVEIRAATADDYRAWYRVDPPHSFKALVGVLDGELIGFGGVFVSGVEAPVAFMDISPAARERPKDLVRATRRLLNAMSREHRLIYALAANDDQAVRFLEHFGFEHAGNAPVGSVYKRGLS